HRLIFGEVELESAGDLFWTPPAGAAQLVLHMLTQSLVASQLGHLRAGSAPLAVPLRSRGPVVPLAAARRGVAPQLSRDRRRVAAQAASDLTHPELLGEQDRDLFTLDKRQVTARRLGQTDRNHTASIKEPAIAGPLRHSRRGRRRGSMNTGRDRAPQP